MLMNEKPFKIFTAIFSSQRRYAFQLIATF